MRSSQGNHHFDSGTSPRSSALGFGLIGLLLAGLPAVLAAQNGQPFDPGCQLPFAAIAVERPIDSICGIEGKTASNDQNHAQNRAKNNFCATGDPVTVTQADFVNLQAAVAAAGIPFGSAQRLPADRSVLHDIAKTSEGTSIGEGTRVRYVTFIAKSHYSDTNSGEAVNCGQKGNPPNDIHIVTVQSPGGDECSSITAEMSPHSRPDGWTPKALKLDVPVRFTGQLFFDGSHAPCTEGHPRNPKRISSWEIHPVYAVDVCTAQTLADCPAGDDSKWHPLQAPPAQ